MPTIVLVIAFVAAIVAPAFAQKAEIDAVNAKWIELFNKGDFDGVASLYTEDATAFPPASAMVKGRTAIAAMWKSIAEQVRDFDAPDTCEDVVGDVAWHLVGKRRERPVLIGTPDGNAKIPEVNRRATLGANDHGQFCLVDRPITERRYLTRKRHLYVAAALIAQEGD